jgi:hypothetical protein
MDLGSGIRKKPIPDPGVKKAPDPGSATLSETLYNGKKKNPTQEARMVAADIPAAVPSTPHSRCLQTCRTSLRVAKC